MLSSSASSGINPSLVAAVKSKNLDEVKRILNDAKTDQEKKALLTQLDDKKDHILLIAAGVPGNAAVIKLICETAASLPQELAMMGYLSFQNSQTMAVAGHRAIDIDDFENFRVLAEFEIKKTITTKDKDGKDQTELRTIHGFNIKAARHVINEQGEVAEIYRAKKLKPKSTDSKDVKKVEDDVDKYVSIKDAKRAVIKDGHTKVHDETIKDLIILKCANDRNKYIQYMKAFVKTDSGKKIFEERHENVKPKTLTDAQLEKVLALDWQLDCVSPKDPGFTANIERELEYWIGVIGKEGANDNEIKLAMSYFNPFTTPDGKLVFNSIDIPTLFDQYKESPLDHKTSPLLSGLFEGINQSDELKELKGHYRKTYIEAEFLIQLMSKGVGGLNETNRKMLELAVLKKLIEISPMYPEIVHKKLFELPLIKSEVQLHLKEVAESEAKIKDAKTETKPETINDLMYMHTLIKTFIKSELDLFSQALVNAKLSMDSANDQKKNGNSFLKFFKKKKDKAINESSDALTLESGKEQVIKKLELKMSNLTRLNSDLGEYTDSKITIVKLFQRLDEIYRSQDSGHQSIHSVIGRLRDMLTKEKFHEFTPSDPLSPRSPTPASPSSGIASPSGSGPTSLDSPTSPGPASPSLNRRSGGGDGDS